MGNADSSPRGEGGKPGEIPITLSEKDLLSLSSEDRKKYEQMCQEAGIDPYPRRKPNNTISKLQIIRQKMQSANNIANGPQQDTTMPGGYPPRTHPIHQGQHVVANQMHPYSPGQTHDQSDVYTHGHVHPNLPSGTYPISSQHPLHPHPPIPLPPNHPAYQHPQNHPVSVMAISRPSHHRNTPSHHSNMDELNNGMSNMKMSNNNWQKAWYSDDSDSDEEERQPNDAYNNNNNKNNNASQQNVGTTNNLAPIQPGSVTNRVDPSLYPPNSSIEQADQQHHQHQLQLEMLQHQQQQQIQSRPTDRVVQADPGNHSFFDQSQEVFPVKLSESMFSQKRVLGKGSFGKVCGYFSSCLLD